jgi:hypothetical protein
MRHAVIRLLIRFIGSHEEFHTKFTQKAHATLQLRVHYASSRDAFNSNLNTYSVNHIQTMTGANYMGGKRSVNIRIYHVYLCRFRICRNAARARTKDSTGRVQKRHFGQQRLAAALCNTKEDKGRPEKISLKSVLHQINLAHAQRDAKIKGSRPSTTHSISTSRDSSFAHGTSFSTSKRRKQPSKILQTLDFSDRM